MKKLLLAVLMLIAAPQLHAQIITTVAGGGGLTDNGVPATDAFLFYPNCLTFDNVGNMYIAVLEQSIIRKVNPAGIITTIAGTGIEGYSGDNGPATLAKLGIMGNLVADNAGNIYFTDMAYNVVRKIDAGGIISTIAGNGTAGFGGDSGPATDAGLNVPFGLAVDNAGNIFISDIYNYRIRKITPSGIISTIAGNGTDANTGDGGPAIAAATQCGDITINSGGELVFTGGDRIRKINASGTITTIAGGGTGNPNDGGPATNVNILASGIAIDNSGNIYLSYGFGHRVYWINTFGVITIFAGTGYMGTGGIGGFSGDGGPAILARLFDPRDIAIGPDGNVYITDQGNYRIRKITKDPNSVPAIINNAGSPRVSPNPSSAAFTISLPEPIKTVQVTDAMGKVVATRNFEGSNTEMVTFNEDNALPAGIYYLQVTTPSGKYNDRVVVQ